jgi:NAD(P)-dependent dehydrogenase (short-subunit alcohol dehydrogenase family)
MKFCPNVGIAMTVWNEEVALVTGAGSGIGRAAALAFAQEGACVIVSDMHAQSGEDTARTIRDMGRQAQFVQADVSKSVDVERLLEQTIARYGRLDFAFNNAGIEGEMATTADCTEENWDRTLAANLKGVWLCMKYELARMLAGGAGAIVNCSSVAGLVGFPQLPAYVASKHAIVGLTRAAALEYATKGIRVNAVCPGVIRTAMVERIEHGHPGLNLAAGEPMGRMGTPEEIAAAVTWLCCDRASFVTGQALAVDGGWIAQ